jgi:hypothetical protein
MADPKDQQPADDETPEVIGHSDEEEQPIIAGDCDDFQGGCVSW